MNVPRQRVVVPRRAGVAGPAGFAARTAGGQVTTTEQQQFVQTRQVVLVPQQVLVPFVQTTVSGPVRVSGAQETSVLNVTNTTTSAVAGGQVAVLPGAVAGGQVAVLPGVPGAVTPGAAGTTASAAAGEPQNMAECMTMLRVYQQRIAQLTAQTEALAAQVQQLTNGSIPAPKPK